MNSVDGQLGKLAADRKITNLPGHQGLKSTTRVANKVSSSLYLAVKLYFPIGASAGGVMVKFKEPVSG